MSYVIICNVRRCGTHYAAVVWKVQLRIQYAIVFRIMKTDGWSINVHHICRSLGMLVPWHGGILFIIFISVRCVGGRCKWAVPSRYIFWYSWNDSARIVIFSRITQSVYTRASIVFIRRLVVLCQLPKASQLSLIVSHYLREIHRCVCVCMYVCNVYWVTNPHK